MLKRRIEKLVPTRKLVRLKRNVLPPQCLRRPLCAFFTVSPVTGFDGASGVGATVGAVFSGCAASCKICFLSSHIFPIQDVPSGHYTHASLYYQKSPKSTCFSGWSRGRDQPRLKFFAPGMLQAPRWRSQYTFQCISTRLDNPLEAGQVGRLVFIREEQLDGGIAKIFKQGNDHSRRLIRIGSREDAFFDPLTNDLLQPRREAFDSGDIEFVAHNGILIGIPHPQVREHQALVLEFPLVERRKEALEF